jgi:hypothetical protein
MQGQKLFLTEETDANCFIMIILLGQGSKE